MNGPFERLEYGGYVVDASGNTVASAEGANETAERKNAEMVCAALNAVYYLALAQATPKDSQ